MTSDSKILDRVASGACELKKILNETTNAPLAQYIDETGLNTIADILSTNITHFASQDFDTILIIRDGLYDLRQHMRDTNDDGEWSVEQLLNHVDRLYVDLERALLSMKEPTVTSAQARLRGLQQGKYLPSNPLSQGLETLQAQATEVLVTSNITQRNIELNLININQININMEAFRDAKLKIQRLSASVFSIRFSLKQSVIFEGVFKFLHDNADRILEELRDFVASIKDSYQTLGLLRSDIAKLIEAGGRFTKQIGDFIRKIFDESPLEERNIDLSVRSYHSTEALSAAFGTSKIIHLGGKHGRIYSLDASSGQLNERKGQPRLDILSMAHLENDRYVVGTDEGIEIRGSAAADRLQGSYQEKIASVIQTQWGGAGSAIITGSKEGYLRRWSSSGSLTQYREGFEQKVFTRKLGRTIQCLMQNGSDILAASGFDIYTLNERLEVKSKIPTQVLLKSMVRLNPNVIMACGDGGVVQINLDSGAYAKLLSSTSNRNYVAIDILCNGVVCICDEIGRISVIEVESGVEIGAAKLGMTVRGLIVNKNRIVVYGGDWSKSGKSLALIDWQEGQG